MLTKNYENVQKQIELACEKAQRACEDVQLIV